MPLFSLSIFWFWERNLVVFLRHQTILAPLLLFIEEAGIPLPLPGDIVIAYLGYRVSRGVLSYPKAFVLILATVMAGSSLLYWLSVRWGQTIVIRLGKYIHLSEKNIKFVETRFRQYGFWVIIFGRHVPIFRVPITFFAGMSGVKYSTFIASTFVSVVFWIAFYLWLGQKLGPGVLRILSSHFRFVPLLSIIIIVLILVLLSRQTKQKY